MKQAKHSFLFLQMIVALLVLSTIAAPVQAQETDKEASKSELRNVDQLKKQITKAGKLFQSEKYLASARGISKVQLRISRLAKRAKGEYRTLLKKQYDRMGKAHKLLSDKGQTMSEIEAFPADPSSAKDSENEDQGISFVKTVAPILNAKCGRCHVARSNGRFSLKDYETLMDSTHVTPGEPDSSYLIEVIENGRMPKGGLKVTAREMKSLKEWIATGAKFDGTDKSKLLNQLRGETANAGQGKAPAAMKMEKPTGNETVSFGTHVAPVLLENCGRCHMTRNNRGNFDMTVFRNFIRGGDSGSPVTPGDSAGSNLIKRLRGIGGDVMPPRGKLDDAVIADVAKWIDEGAKFDPVDATLPMASVAAKSKAKSLNHDELSMARKKEAQRIWKLAMSDEELVSADSENFHIVAAASDEGLDEIAKEAEALIPDIQRVLETETRDHFIRGNATIFVLNRRYDFSEFGKMVQKRDFPRVLKAYWNHNTTIAYSTTLRPREQSMEEYRVLLARTLASVHIADLETSIPRWFADGMGFVAASELYGKNEQVRAWEQDAIDAANSMKQPGDFLNGKLDEDKAGLVSYIFVSQLRSDKRRFKKLMQAIESGQDFEESFASIYRSTPEKFFDGYKKQWK